VTSINLVFLGTSQFAVPTLQLLFEKGYSVGGVITQPDKPVGRGQTVQFSPVKRKALELQLHVHQPFTLKDDAARVLFEALQPDVLVVVAYGKIIPPWLIAMPRFGVVNLHGSLLPKYRGAAPIQWAIAKGETETGVCTMKIDEGLDTGPVYGCERTPIGPDETQHDLSARLSDMGAALMPRTLDGIFAGTLQPTPQDHARASLAPILRKEDGYIDWSRPAQFIHDRIRAFNPWPPVVAEFRQNICKLLKSKVAVGAVYDRASSGHGLILASKKALSVVCGDATALEILELQLPNRKPLSGKDFMNGMRIQAGEKFEPVRDNVG